MHATQTDSKQEEEEDLGDFTHPSGREERAGGVTRTIQKVVSVQLQTHPPRIGQTETKGTQTSRQKPPGQRNIQTIKQRRRARKGQNTENPDCKEPAKRCATRWGGVQVRGKMTGITQSWEVLVLAFLIL